MVVVALVAAGSVGLTTDLLTGLSRSDSEIPMTWRLHDTDAERLETAAGVARALVSEHGLRAVVETHDQRRSALEGADAVVVTAMVGGLEAARADLTIPAELGLRQTVGDSLGVGGIFRGLRSAGFYRALADDVRALCPDAWVLNCTNPMAITMALLRAVAPDVKALGVSRSVRSTVEGLCEIVGVPAEETTLRASGMNQQSWVVDWRLGDEDLHPRLDAAIDADPQLARRVRLDMYRRLGHVPTGSSERSAELVPWYLHSDAEVERLRLQPGQGTGAGEDDVTAGDDAAAIIAALSTGTPVDVHATVANDGFIVNLPNGTPVEVPVTVDADGVHPRSMGLLPPTGGALSRHSAYVVDHTVRAAVREDPTMVRRAALLDLNTSASLTPGEIDTVLTRLTAAHRANLPAGLADARYGDAPA